jgi:hypothetical protein
MKTFAVLSILALSTTAMHAQKLTTSSILESFQSSQGTEDYAYTLGLITGVMQGSPETGAECVRWPASATAETVRLQVRDIIAADLVRHPEDAKTNGIAEIRYAEMFLFPCSVK